MNQIPRLVENPNGVGRLTAPNEDIEVGYHLTVFEEILESGIPGMRSIVGVVIARGKNVIPTVGQKYVLHLEDGRKLNVYVDSGSGQVRGTGGWF